MNYQKRTHKCDELRSKNSGQEVVLNGWVKKIREHGNVTFIDLNDRFGITQTIINSDDFNDSNISLNDVIWVKGKVKKRPEPNDEIKTGDIEIDVTDFGIINKSKPSPIDDNANLETKLEYRFLDLRNKNNMNKIIKRHQIINFVRDYFNKNNFLEIETPLLMKSTPEGARDYIVPSRVNKGKFYALPQSPQLYKQILMISGFDRYFQVAKCLRDEDLRKDRQPEHTQFDFEMSFVDSSDIRNFVEDLFKDLFKEFLDIKLDDFSILTYDESMKNYGTDKPDLRYDLKLSNFTEVGNNSDFNIFKNADSIRGIAVNEDFSRNEIDELTDVVKEMGAKGLAYVKVNDQKLESGISKFFKEEEKEEIVKISNINNGTIFFVADKDKIVFDSLDKLRRELARKLNLIDEDKYEFAWIVDFPLFSYDEDEGRWAPEHHMFSMPKKEYLDTFDEKPGEVKGDLWDLVLNGVELGSGSIRISDPNIQRRVMNLIGLSNEEAKKRFGFLLNAYKYGAPVHGGMGLGADRIIALMLGESDIREVIPFPKNKNAENPMDGSPSSIDKEQLDELGISLKK